MLATEFPASELTIAQLSPQNFFRGGLFDAERTRTRLEAVHPLTRLSRCTRQPTSPVHAEHGCAMTER
jgi:hypothetical protein